MDRTEVWLKWGGTISIPGDVCVSCGSVDRVTKSLIKTGHDTDLHHQTTVKMSFPLCEACDLACGDRSRGREIEASVKVLPKTPGFGGKWKMGFSFANPLYASLFTDLNRDSAPGRSPNRPATTTTAKPHVPDVKAAKWRHAYPGRPISAGALALILAIGVPLALGLGVVAYVAGPTASSASSQVVQVAGSVAGNLWKPETAAHQGAVGALTSLALMGGGTILAWIVACFVLLMIGGGIPFLMGAIAGSGVAWAAVTGKWHSPGIPDKLGVLAGGMTYAAFVGVTLLMQAPLHETSHVLGSVGPPGTYGIMAVDAFLVVAGASGAVASVYKVPFCEPCKKWFGQPTTTTLPITGASSLVAALATGSAVPLEAVPVGVTDGARIKLDLSRCTCGRSECELVTTVQWDSVTQRSAGEPVTVAMSEPWFRTALSATLGAQLERWSLGGAVPGA